MCTDELSGKALNLHSPIYPPLGGSRFESFNRCAITSSRWLMDFSLYSFAVTFRQEMTLNSLCLVLKSCKMDDLFKEDYTFQMSG